MERVEGIWRILDRKSTRLNSSHRCTSYAVFCLKKNTNTHFQEGGLESAARHTAHKIYSRSTRTPTSKGEVWRRRRAIVYRRSMSSIFFMKASQTPTSPH